MDYGRSTKSAGIAARSFLIQLWKTSFTNSSASLCGRCSVTRSPGGSQGCGKCSPSPVMDARRVKASSVTEMRYDA